MAGGHAWPGDMNGQGACMARGHAWQGGEWPGACMAWGACMGGVHGGGHVWQGDVRDMYAPPPGQILWLQHTVNERAVRILLECILFIQIYL